MTGLITSAGFRDLLEIRRQMRPSLYDLQCDKPDPVVPRWLRFEVPERLRHDGRVKTPLEEAALREAGVGAVAIVFLYAFVDSVHERRARAVVETEMPGAFITCSHEVAPEFREPVPAHLTQSNGGVIPCSTAATEPVRTVLSGPSTGVVWAIDLARADHFAFDIAQNRGCDPVDAVQIEAANGLGGPREKIGRDFAGRAGPALDRQAPDCVEPGPERQQQHRQGAIGRRLQVALARDDVFGRHVGSITFLAPVFFRSSPDQSFNYLLTQNSPNCLIVQAGGSMISIERIANDVGVSIATVSNALTGKGRVSQEVVDRIQARAEELGYRPSIAARALKTGHTGILGLVMPDLTTPLFPRIAQTLSIAADKRKLGILIADSRGSADEQSEAFRRLLDRGMDGLLAIPQ